jgi:FKBP-type peptidyl-prolyl cis-trans isomerase FklB
VKVKYEGRLIDGTVFDSTDKHGGQPATFAPSQVIKGWTEALTMMPVGSKWQLYIPQELGYGSPPSGMIPAYSTLVFDVEVLDIEEKKSEK